MNGTSWTTCPVIFRERIVCPVCGSLSTPEAIRTMKPESDGSYCRRVVCSDCDEKFLIVFELPEFGRDEINSARITADDHPTHKPEDLTL